MPSPIFSSVPTPMAMMSGADTGSSGSRITGGSINTYPLGKTTPKVYAYDFLNNLAREM